ncbi:hypothetical protein KJ359_005707 [Pestalotiopsis sp. 9143b]|nr:hypothetical protein KJ359_005707 [Pestalotiopsis sp. 9143b]
MAPHGLLVPPWYVDEILESTILNACSIIWGFSLCSAMFSATKASRQSWSAYKKGKLFTAYPIMVWAEWTASVTISVISWLFLKGTIPARSQNDAAVALHESIAYQTFHLVVLWVVQMQCILQIIINRVSLVMVNKAFARRLRLIVFFIVLLINISVFIIWMPARLQISQTYVHVNDIWDRIEKGIFAVVDACLNVYFLWTVRHNLIAAGLTKYKPLYRFNMAMICCSISLDVVLIGSMSIGTGVIYIQFHPLVYLLKLHIELNMADLIAKVVRASNPLNNHQDVTDNTTSSGMSGSQKRNTQGSIPPSAYPHRDSGYVSTIMSKETTDLESGRHTSVADQARRISGVDYHKAIRPNLQLTRTGETILDDADGETASENSLRENEPKQNEAKEAKENESGTSQRTFN